MAKQPDNGTVRDLGGKKRVHYEGYWIRYYPPPEETLTARKNLIEQLARRTFHHTEAGINTPGDRLDLRQRPTAAASAGPGLSPAGRA